jgi:hypothetical protein
MTHPESTEVHQIMQEKPASHNAALPAALLNGDYKDPSSN